MRLHLYCKLMFYIFSCCFYHILIFVTIKLSIISKAFGMTILPINLIKGKPGEVEEKEQMNYSISELQNRIQGFSQLVCYSIFALLLTCPSFFAYILLVIRYTAFYISTVFATAIQFVITNWWRVCLE